MAGQTSRKIIKRGSAYVGADEGVRKDMVELVGKDRNFNFISEDFNHFIKP